jgi:hypothetical protein
MKILSLALGFKRSFSISRFSHEKYTLGYKTKTFLPIE